MLITSVELHPGGSAAVAVLSLRDPGRQNPYNVKRIDGLDAGEIMNRFYGGSGDSARFFSLAMERREMTVHVELNPRWSQGESPASLRDDLYRLIASTRTGLLEVQFKYNTTVVAVISGFVTKVETPQFEKNQTVEIGIVCEDNPMLQAPSETVIDVSTLDEGNTTILDEISTAPHGFKFAMAFSASRPTFEIKDPDDATWSFGVSPAGGFVNGDVLHFSSEHDDKYLYLVRGGVTTHLADKIVSGSVWPILFPDENKLAVTTPAGTAWSAISHRHTYWGV